MREIKPLKIPKLDERMLEEWNKWNPKIGYEESKIRVAKLGRYGNYELRDKLMEVIQYLKNPLNVCVVAKENQKFFKELEQEIIDKAWALARLL